MKKKMPKLSTLIMRGVKKDGPKITGNLFRLNKDLKISGCCALGAAMLGGFGVDVEKARLEIIAKVRTDESWSHPKAIQEHVESLLNNKVNSMLGRLRLTSRRIEHELALGWVVSKNDDYGWSREKIAAKLKALGL